MFFFPKNQGSEDSNNADDLTGLFNKRFFQEAFYREGQRAKRYGIDLSLVFIDIDDFRKCNELHGHPFGDKVLKKVASIIKASVREVDYPWRFGGDEFVVILPEIRGPKAVIAAKRVQREIEKTSFLPGKGFGLTASAGIASYGIDGNAADMIIENADTAKLGSELRAIRPLIFRTGYKKMTTKGGWWFSDIDEDIITGGIGLHIAPKNVSVDLAYNNSRKTNIITFDETRVTDHIFALSLKKGF